MELQCVALIQNRQQAQADSSRAGAAIDLGYGNEVHFLSPRKLKLATAAEFNEYIDFIC